MVICQKYKLGFVLIHITICINHLWENVCHITFTFYEMLLDQCCLMKVIRGKIFAFHYCKTSSCVVFWSKSATWNHATFWCLWIRSAQTGSNWIKLDFHKSKIVTIKSCHIYRNVINACYVFDFFGSDLSKMDQTWSNLIKLDFLTF